MDFQKRQEYKILSSQRRNRVLTLQNESGEWVNKKTDVKNLVLSCYKALFNDDTQAFEDVVVEINFPVIN